MPERWLEIRAIPRDWARLRPYVTIDEWEDSASKPPARRAEWLAWRALVRERLGKNITISYDSNGAPRIAQGTGYIGVSHTKGWVAVAWSRQPCAVDIELVSRDVSRTVERFLSEDERNLHDAGKPEFAISVWCAKEALYKFSGIRDVDFRTGVTVLSSDLAAGRMTGTVRDSRPVTVELSFRDGLVIAAVF